MNPYQCLTTPQESAPLIQDDPVRLGQKRLVFAQSLPANTVVFAERPLAQSLPINAEHKAEFQSRYNNSAAWSIVDELCRGDVDQIFRTGYVETFPWEKEWDKGDDKVLETLTATHQIPAPTIKRLYVLVCANNVVCQSQRVPTEDPGVVLEFAARQVFFPLLAQANHSCYPSTTMRIPRTKDGAVEIITTRDVRAGDELTFSYVGDMNRQDTRRYLWDTFGFHCSCELCAPRCLLDKCTQVGQFQCKRCRLVRYCCKEHQKEDWVWHKKECKDRGLK
jgi:hypothetical protein